MPDFHFGIEGEGSEEVLDGTFQAAAKEFIASLSALGVAVKRAFFVGGHVPGGGIDLMSKSDSENEASE